MRSINPPLLRNGHMFFIFCDADTKQIIEDRPLSSLQAYFKRYTKEAREPVKHIVIDRYAPYIRLIKELFPQAKMVIDKFHLVQHLSRAINKTRIRFTKKFKLHARKSKRYWRLFLKSHTLPYLTPPLIAPFTASNNRCEKSIS